MNAAQPLIKLEGVKKVFYTDEVETHALDNINMEIRSGEYVAIAGPSGCGRSIRGTVISPVARRSGSVASQSKSHSYSARPPK